MLALYNSLAREKQQLSPIENDHVRMYVCGPTVYDRPHLGNARSVVIYDVLFRVLQLLYPQVTYVRNITDVDDKINAAAKENGEAISDLTKRVEGWFRDDMDALNVLSPTYEPRATKHIAHMIAMIESLLKEKHAYVSEGHVLFAVESYKEYGALSGRKLDELVAGARVEVESYKKHPGDFVLWKPADAEDDASAVFDSPWGKGRPGWHIECSAMSKEFLGANFDIHGGGADLKFPHHENEIAQSCCAMPGSAFAKTWVHNGFLTVGGEKMSKSLGNFTTVKDLLDQGVKGEVIRFAFLSTHYRSPLDWTQKLLSDSKKAMDYFYAALRAAQIDTQTDPACDIDGSLLDDSAVLDDLNIPLLMSELHSLAGKSYKAKELYHKQLHAKRLLALGTMLGFFYSDADAWFKGGDEASDDIDAQLLKRQEAKQEKNWAEADRIRDVLVAQGIILEDRPDGTTDWRRG